MTEQRGGDVVDFNAVKNVDRSPELHVKCPRCGESNFMRDEKCQHCGVWFSGEAFQFAPSEPRPDRRRLILRIVLWYLLAVAVFLAIAVVFGGLKR